ncbi:hypothetical protein G5B37_14865 [Rasiella rasia]|uniref:Uncharacterized protein n=1 Tax=Rasiella rasia TaxID=2744027 RepID=A0A6G6GQQ1_9FLAO|nr:DUF6122 family protein [Rasiella rasia]QIE60790.1 hypothetical protein G5B37_14865 [Rasiella rasia]
MLQTSIHYGLHFLVPVAFAYIFYQSNWKQVSLILLATMLVDLDHLFATPIFDPERCSIGFHYLHSYWAIGVYILLLFFKKTRIVAIGLVWHMITDAIDCYWMG